MKAVERAVLAPSAFDGFEPLEVLGRFDLLGAIPAASVHGDNMLPIEHPDVLERCDDSHSPADALVRHGVVVEVEASVGRLSDLDGNAIVGRELIGRQSQEAWLLLGEHVADEPLVVFGTSAAGCVTVAPNARL